MSKSVVAKVCVSILAAVVICGCAGVGKGPSDQELVKMRVDEFWNGIVAKDLERTMAAVSEKFYNSELGDKAAAKERLKDIVESGMIQADGIDQSKAETKIEKDTASVYPIMVSASAGSVTVGLTLKKEKAEAKPAADKKEKAGKKPKLDWFITDINVEGA